MLLVYHFLINLINKALKFTEDGGVTWRGKLIEAKKYLIKHKPSKVNQKTIIIKFEIEYPGMVISGHKLEKLFQAFVQNEAGGSSQDGTGFGLSISREFVHLYSSFARSMHNNSTHHDRG